jgi:hypothetical protein
MALKTDDRDRFRGCLLGLACGDAVGTTVEFRPRGTFEPVSDMVGGGPLLKPGEWTDDFYMSRRESPNWAGLSPRPVVRYRTARSYKQQCDTSTSEYRSRCASRFNSVNL